MLWFFGKAPCLPDADSQRFGRHLASQGCGAVALRIDLISGSNGSVHSVFGFALLSVC